VVQLPATRPFYPRLEAFRDGRHLAALVLYLHGYAIGQRPVDLLPLALETSAWYSARSLSMTAVSIALAIYGAGTAAARRVHPRHRAVPVLSTAR
jgi:hypothetical protein